MKQVDVRKQEICIVDDEPLILSAISRLLINAGFSPRSYNCGEALIADRASVALASCIILDISMPNMDGLEVQARLRKMSIKTPILFLSGHADISMAVAAMRAGAADFIEKPFNNDELVVRLRRAIPEDNKAQDSLRKIDALRRLANLTPREYEVLDLVSAGLTSKEIARRLSCSHRTVEIHRQRIMEKTRAESLAELVRLHITSQRAGL